MTHLRIFCDSRLDEAQQAFLRDGIAPHELLLPKSGGDSILEAAAADPAISEADITLGQPGVDSVLNSPKLRWLQITSAGFTRYDTPDFRAAAKARGLIVTNSSGVYAEACAEHVFAFMLSQARHLPTALHTRRATTSADWLALRKAATCLQHQKVVILGYGTIAARLVELLAPFKMQITAMRRAPRGDEGIPIVTSDTLSGPLSAADHVIDILPDNPASIRFVSEARLKEMKPGAVLYNIGRGTTVDHQALVASLASGRLGAAWLDVTDPEPLPDGHPLLSAPNCFITPHIAGAHRNESETLIRHFLGNLERFVGGRFLVDRVI